METHQTSDLRIAGSTPAMLVFFPFCLVILRLIPIYLTLFLYGNVAQSVERKSHNLKVVSSILTVPTFFTFFLLMPVTCTGMILLFSISYILYGHMAQWKRIRLRI